MAIKVVEGKPLRDMSFAKEAATTVGHLALVPEVQHALSAWIRAKTGKVAPGVLIGGLAMSFYCKPRYTEDIDLLFLSESDIPKQVEGFKQVRSGAFQENVTHVEVEVTSPKTFMHLSPVVLKKVVDTAVEHEGLRVASIEGLITLKLFSAENVKRTMKDLGDVERLVESDPSVDLTGWPLTAKQHDLLRDIKDRLQEK